MNRHYHLIGIGGIGMSGIAKLLLACGARVSGSDLKESMATEDLRKKGAEVFIGHRADNLGNADFVIYSTAIKKENPELIKAEEKGIVMLKRAQALAQLMDGKNVITVTGSHGKTTTASLISFLLLEANFSPTVAVGGVLRNIDNNACFGDGSYFVAEADESDGSFLYYHPKYSVITNIDREHLDYYGSFDNLIDAYAKFINMTQEGGCLFANGEDQNLKFILNKFEGRYLLFGFSEDYDIYPANIEFSRISSSFDCFFRANPIGRFELSLGGRHNISNALSVIALGLELGIELDLIKRTLRNYRGAKRRLEVKFEDKNTILIDDYAHHPTEIKATLEAIRPLNVKKRIVIFQPHRFTRTKMLLDEFARSFDLADLLIVTDIYAASEPPIEGINALKIIEKIKELQPYKKALYLPKEEIKEYILNNLEDKDLILTLGAGDITKVCDELEKSLKK